MNVEQLKQPLKTMVPASLSRLQDNTEEFSRYYVLALTMWSLVGCGVIGLVTAEAPAIVNLMLGDQWLFRDSFGAMACSGRTRVWNRGGNGVDVDAARAYEEVSGLAEHCGCAVSL